MMMIGSSTYSERHCCPSGSPHGTSVVRSALPTPSNKFTKAWTWARPKLSSRSNKVSSTTWLTWCTQLWNTRLWAIPHRRLHNDQGCFVKRHDAHCHWWHGHGHALQFSHPWWEMSHDLMKASNKEPQQHFYRERGNVMWPISVICFNTTCVFMTKILHFGFIRGMGIRGCFCLWYHSCLYILITDLQT